MADSVRYHNLPCLLTELPLENKSTSMNFTSFQLIPNRVEVDDDDQVDPVDVDDDPVDPVDDQVDTTSKKRARRKSLDDMSSSPRREKKAKSQQKENTPNHRPATAPSNLCQREKRENTKIKTKTKLEIKTKPKKTKKRKKRKKPKAILSSALLCK